MPECQKCEKGELDQHGAERFGRLMLQSEKCGTERVKAALCYARSVYATCAMHRRKCQVNVITYAAMAVSRVVCSTEIALGWVHPGFGRVEYV